MSIIGFCTMRHILVAAEVLLCEFVFIYGYERRKKFWLRAVLAFLGVMLVAVGCGHLMSFTITGIADGNYTVMSCICYFTTFLASVCGYFACYRIRARQLWFCAVSGYCMRQLIFCCYIFIIAVLLPEFNLLNIEYTSWAAAGIYLGIYAALFALCFFIFVRPISRSRDYDVGVSVLVMFAVVLFVNVIVNAVSELYSQEHFQLYVIGLIIEIVCMTLILFVQTLLLDRLQLKNEKQIVNTILEQQEKQYKFAEVNAELLSIKAHDLKHQVAVLRAGGEEAEKLLRSIEDVTGAYDTVIKTDNTAVNIVISEKWMYCRSHDIKLSCIVNPKALAFMENIDVYSLLGNLLDNCIEAVEGLESAEQRVISCNIADHSGVVSVATKNYFSGELAIKDGLPQTSKSDKTSHGFGTRSIRRIVEKYGGSVYMSADDGIFNVNITFSR